MYSWCSTPQELYCLGSEPLPAYHGTIRSTQQKKNGHSRKLLDDKGKGHVKRNADADPKESDKPWLKKLTNTCVWRLLILAISQLYIGGEWVLKDECLKHTCDVITWHTT